jgi:hypothetical protein
MTAEGFVRICLLCVILPLWLLSGEELILTLRERLPGGVRRREDAGLRIADR